MKCLSISLLYVLFFIFQSQFCCSFSSPSSTTSSVPQRHNDERSALLHLKSTFSIATDPGPLCDYYNTGSYSNAKTTTWNESTNYCTWDGITCDGVTGHVVGLNLSCSWLQGTITSNSSLFFLRHLRRLDLSSNDFRGSPILQEFGQFKDMTHLALSFSNFSGDVPVQISHLSKLISFQLGAFDGELKFGPTTLKAVNHNLTSLRELDLSGIDMSDVPLLSLMNLSSSLTSLHLSSCKLRGKLPENVFQMPKLQVLDLSINDALTGSFPKSNWSNSLRELDLSDNGFSVDTHLLKSARFLSHLSLGGCHFVGSYTTFLDNLTQLVYLDLSFNDLSGQIPWSSFNLKRLRSLDLSENNFIGQIPEVNYANSTKNSSSGESSKYQLTRAPSSLTTLSLSFNSLNGTLPSWIFALPNLTELYLQNNLFSGEIDEFQSTSLTSLFLSQNKLHGLVPISIFQNLNLGFLDLSSNNFMGHLELGKLSELKDLVYLDLSFNNLSLSVKNSINYTLDHLWVLSLSSCNLSEFPTFFRYSKSLYRLDLSNNQIDGSVPKWLWEVGKDSLGYVNVSYNFLTHMEPILPRNYLEVLDIQSNLFSGPLPISSSPVLYLLLASRNQFTGDISTSFCNMASLAVLDLSNNSLSGSLPSCFGNFDSSLRVLDLSCNSFSGNIPPGFGNLTSSLSVLDLSYNSFSGNIPPGFGNLTSSLSVLDLSYNSFSGNFPPGFGNLTSSLSVLDLRMNKFHGTIDLAFAKGNSLKTLNLNGNELEGPLPRSLLNCEMLEVLDVGNNSMNGSFPQWLESLPLLQVLILRSNRFYGSISNPKTRFPFPMLRIIDISNNAFSGLLPAKYFENFVAMMDAHAEHLEYMGTNDYYQDSVMVVMKGFDIQLEKIISTFTTIDVSMNNFEGVIPTSIGKLKSLKGLNLSHNKLVGHIPLSLQNLSNLEWLDLSSNELSGEIPNELAAELTQLAFLNLSLNKLVGPIPRGNQFGTFENGSYIGNLGICGLPLSKTCINEGAQQPSQANSGHEDDGIDWKIVLMGFGSGMVIGISMGYMVLPDRTIEWLVDIVKVHWTWRKARQSRRNARRARRTGRRN